MKTGTHKRFDQVMPFVNGKSFHCECGCNVFTKKYNRYWCNSCGAAYFGVKHTHAKPLNPATERTKTDALPSGVREDVRGTEKSDPR